MSIKTCPNSNNCEMYAILRHAGSLATWKINYCDAEFTRCARHKRSRSGQAVPINLMPNGALLRKPGAPLTAIEAPSDATQRKVQ